MKSGKIKVKTQEKIFLIFNVFSFVIITGEVSGKNFKNISNIQQNIKKRKNIKNQKKLQGGYGRSLVITNVLLYFVPVQNRAHREGQTNF